MWNGSAMVAVSGTGPAGAAGATGPAGPSPSGTPNKVLATDPTGSSTNTAALRALVAADIPAVLKSETIVPETDATKGLVINGHSGGQAANLQEWQYNGTAQSYVNASGAFNLRQPTAIMGPYTVSSADGLIALGTRSQALSVGVFGDTSSQTIGLYTSGTEQLHISNSGIVTISSTLIVGSNIDFTGGLNHDIIAWHGSTDPGLLFKANDTYGMKLTGSDLQFASQYTLAWSNAAPYNATLDVRISRLGPGSLSVDGSTRGDSAGSIKAKVHSTGSAIWTSGVGSPEGVAAAVVGSMYTRTDGGAGTTLYVKESGSGNTGWVAK